MNLAGAEPAAGAPEARLVRRDAWIAAAAALLLYVASVPASVWWGDSAEFSIRAAHLELSPIARGYPLHRLLSWVLGEALGSPAAGSNVLSALFGAVSAGLACALGTRISGLRAGGAAAAGTLALCPVFWLYAGVAEVYTMHTALLLGLIWSAWECGRSARAPWLLGVLFGLSFLHHRMTAFAAPGVLLLAAGRLGDAAEPPRSRAAAASRGLLRVLAGFGAGIVPFVVLCALASRSPPPGTDDAFRWWVGDVFLGGDKNAAHLFGSGKKSFLTNSLYVLRWVLYGLPGPAALLAAAGFAGMFRRGTRRSLGVCGPSGDSPAHPPRPHGAACPASAGIDRDAGPRTDGWAFALLVAVHVVFPFRYDWTGDQFSFLIPLLAIAAVLVAPGLAHLARWRPGWVRPAAVSVAAVPAAVALVLALTPLGAKAWPGLEPAARRTLALPLRLGDASPEKFAAGNLSRLPAGAVLHTDWGDGQVYLYLQRVNGVRNDVEVRIWYGRGPALRRSGRDEWISAMPGQAGGPPVLRALAPEIEDAGGGLFRVRAASGGPR